MAATNRATNPEGWAELKPDAYRGWPYRGRSSKRWPRVQHYFLDGRALCGKRSLGEAGIAAPVLFLQLEARPGINSLPSAAKPDPEAGPPCPRCAAREATYMFRRRR